MAQANCEYSPCKCYSVETLLSQQLTSVSIEYNLVSQKCDMKRKTRAGSPWNGPPAWQNTFARHRTFVLCLCYGEAIQRLTVSSRNKNNSTNPKINYDDILTFHRPKLIVSLHNTTSQQPLQQPVNHCNNQSTTATIINYF